MPKRTTAWEGSDNPRWAAVDTYAMSHSHPSSYPNAQAMQGILAASDAAGLPMYAVSPAQAKFLALHCRTAGVTHALEVGTLGGFSAGWIASQNPELHLTTIEYNPWHFEIARENIQRAGLADRIEVIHGAGLDVLPRLREEVRAGTRAPFGFTFIDADKVNNWEYFHLARDMSKPNAVIVVDNIVRDGQLVEESSSDPYLNGCREVVENAGKEAGVDSVVLQTVGEKGYDGWLWAVVS